MAKRRPPAMPEEPTVNLDLAEASARLYDRLLNAYSTVADAVDEVGSNDTFIAEDPADSTLLVRWLRAHTTQLVDAHHLLADLGKRLDALVGANLLPPAQYRVLWRSIIETWNRAHTLYDWWALQPLCQSCGRPVPVRFGRRMKGQRARQSLYCSERCRRANTERLGKQRRKRRR